MPYPKISATLNNCPLHVFTPALRDQIAALAQTDARHPYRAKYELLKTYFAQFYQISESDLTWQTFHNLLSSYNPFDLQIILGPVLRVFLRGAMSQKDPETLDILAMLMIEHPDMDPEAFITSQTEILPPDGRYESLSPEETYLFLARPLGFNLTYHKGGQVRSVGEEDSDRTNRLAHIEIQHSGGISGASSGGHWELYGADDERVDYEKEASTQLAGYIPLLGNDIRVTPTAIECLKQHVLLTYRRLTHGDDSSLALRELALTVAQIEKFLFNINHVEINLAKRLLGPRTTAAEFFINHFQVSGIQYDPAFNQLITENLVITENLAGNIQFAPPSKTADVRLDFAQYHLALTLLAPPVILTHAMRLRNSEPREASSRSRLLRADEVSALVRVQYILFNEGLSNALYATCNQPHITDLLTPEFIRLLMSDDNFLTKAVDGLKSRALALFPNEYANIPLNNPLPELVAEELEPVDVVSASEPAPDFHQSGSDAIPDIMLSTEGSTGFLIDLVCCSNSTVSLILQGALVVAALALLCTGVGGLVGCVACASALTVMSLSSVAAVTIGASVCGFFAVAKWGCSSAEVTDNTSLSIQ